MVHSIERSVKPGRILGQDMLEHHAQVRLERLTARDSVRSIVRRWRHSKLSAAPLAPYPISFHAWLAYAVLLGERVFWRAYLEGGDEFKRVMLAQAVVNALPIGLV